MPRIEQLDPSQWEIFREVRLNALRDTPNAFGSTFEKEQDYREDEWKMRLARSDCRTFVASLTDLKPIGIIVGAPYDDQAGLFSMWVDSNQRKKGIGGLLIDVLIAWAENNDFHEIRLDVGDDNHSAIALYNSKGFIQTGVIGSLPVPRDYVTEHQRILTIK